MSIVLLLLLKGVYLHQERRWRKSRGNDDQTCSVWSDTVSVSRGHEKERNYCVSLIQYNYYNTVYVEIFAKKKFSPISPHALIGDNFIMLIFCPVIKDCIADIL